MEEEIKQTLLLHQDKLVEFSYKDEIKSKDYHLVFYNMSGEGVMLGFFDKRVDSLIHYKYAYLPPHRDVRMSSYDDSIEERTVTILEATGVYKNESIRIYIPFKFEKTTVPRKFIATVREWIWGEERVEFTEKPSYTKTEIDVS